MTGAEWVISLVFTQYGSLCKCGSVYEIPRVSGIMYKRISHDYSSQQLYFNQNIDNITQTNINLSEKENIILNTFIRFLLSKVVLKVPCDTHFYLYHVDHLWLLTQHRTHYNQTLFYFINCQETTIFDSTETWMIVCQYFILHLANNIEPRNWNIISMKYFEKKECKKIQYLL